MSATAENTAKMERRLVAAALSMPSAVLSMMRHAGFGSEFVQDRQFRAALAAVERLSEGTEGVLNPKGVEKVANEVEPGAINYLDVLSWMKDDVSLTEAGDILKDLSSAARKRHMGAALEQAKAQIFKGNGLSAEEIEEILAAVRTAGAKVATKDSKKRRPKPLTAFQPPPKDDPATLLGDRYVCRGHSCLIVGGSGIGKSTLAYQMSVEWAIGSPFFGIRPARQLKSLHIQAEDEDGDIGEVWASIREMRNLSPEEQKLVEENVIIHTEKLARGEKFIAVVKALLEKHKPDLVWINPLHAYMDGDIKDAEAVGKFCREGLAQLNPDDRHAWMIVHHTPKPQVGDKKKVAREWHEVMYEAAGSADLINWARAIMVLKPRAEQGKFDLYLAKRGTRAGVVKAEPQGETGNTISMKPLTVIPMNHAQGTVKYEDREIRTLYWVNESSPAMTTENTDQPAAPAAPKHAKPSEGETYPDGECVGILMECDPDGVGLKWETAAQNLRDATGMSQAMTANVRNRLLSTGFVRREGSIYKVSDRGKAAAEDFKKSIP